jgi:hypothetical protein
MQDRKRNLQATCDAAALAGAADIYLNDSFALDNPTATPGDVAGATASATEYCRLNGYTADGTMNFITVNIPPTSGLFTGVNGYIEVIMEHREPRRFSAIFGSGNLPIKARAVARGGYQAVGDGILVLDRFQKGSLKSGGSGSGNSTGGAIKVNVNGAKVIVNSNDTSAGFGAGNVIMDGEKGFDVTGNVNDPTVFIGGPLTSGTQPVPDPMRGLPIPDKTTMPAGTDTVTDLGGGAKLHTLTPGVYAGGLKFSGQDSIVMQPGIYFMDLGGFSFSGQGSMTATGVMIYNDPQPGSNSQGLSITGSAAVNWSAPTTGTYAGVAYFQDRTDGATDTISGNGLYNIQGMFYSASAQVNISGNGDAKIGSQFIARYLSVQGNGSYQVAYNPNLSPRHRILQLVE